MRDGLSHLFALDGRVALVTGGSSGIGLGIARALGMQGARLVLTARRAPELQEAVVSLAAEGIVAEAACADLAQAQNVKALCDELARRDVAVDILVNAAGMNLRQPFEEVEAEAFDLHMAVHLRAPFLLVQALAPGMARRGWGRVVNIASLQSVRAFANSAPYGAAKSGIVQLTRAMAEVWSSRGIACNAIAPGFFPTALTEGVFADAGLAGRHAAQTMVGRNGRIEDLYGAAVFFASDAAAYVTGQTLFVDGGYSAR